MNRTTMPQPAAFEFFGKSAQNFPDDYSYPPVAIARPAINEFREWLAAKHPGSVPAEARKRTVEVPNYGRIEITVEDGVQTEAHKKYGEPAPQWLVWSVFDTRGTKTGEGKWQR